jgi:hypothetical protein
LDDQALIPGQGRDFSLHYHVQIISGAHPVSYQEILGALSLGIKQLDCEIDHSPPSGAEDTSVWSYISTPPYVYIVLN